MAQPLLVAFEVRRSDADKLSLVLRGQLFFGWEWVLIRWGSEPELRDGVERRRENRRRVRDWPEATGGHVETF